MSNVYLDRYAYPQKHVACSAYSKPDLIIVLPCHDEPDLLESLESIEACHLPIGEVVVIVMINASEVADEQTKARNQKTFDNAKEWSVLSDRKFHYHIILDNELPKKHAGVGLARKIGMDEAVRMFEAQQKDGIILCYDADSTCDENLLIEVEKIFSDNPNMPGCSIHFEHPLEGKFANEVYEGILNYELHLRYYVNGLKYAGFPYAFQTIGSSMAVRSSAYQKQGGMNRRKAGEDFYFLHKIIPLGNFKELNTTKIVPSPRRSERVPFGTGRAIGLWLDEGNSELYSYNPLIFNEIKQFLDFSRHLHQSQPVNMTWNAFPQAIKQFIPLNEFEGLVSEFNSQSKSVETFNKRFFQWFDGFKVLKFVHFARDEFYANVSITKGVDWLFDAMSRDSKNWNLHKKLKELRLSDKAQ